MSTTIPEGILCEYGCFRQATHQFSNGRYCCETHNSKCPAQKQKILKTYKQSCLEIYGVENAFQSPVVQNKYKQTCLEKYGVESPMQLKEFQDKHWETRRINNPPKPKPKKIKKKPIRWKFDLKEKKCKFCGAPAIYRFKSGGWCCKKNAHACPVIKEKSKQTFLKTYGVDNPLKVKEIKEKRKQTCLDTYGVESVMQIKEVKEKKDQTMIDTYGTRIYAETTEFKDHMAINWSGENNPGWRGGVSFEPYCEVWQDREYKEDIKKRDGRTCQNCGITEQLSLIVYGRTLCIHHINYDKKDCTLQNLITTCVSCNAKANTKRSEWQSYYQKIITERIYPN